MAIHRLPAWAYTIIATVPVLILAGADFVFFYSSGWDAAARIGLIIPALVWATIFAFIGWRRLDESGREAHKFAWLYGGGFGLCAMLLSVMAVYLIPAGGDLADALVDRWASKWPPGQGGFALGVLAAAIAQVVGYAIVWSGWWLAKRR